MFCRILYSSAAPLVSIICHAPHLINMPDGGLSKFFQKKKQPYRHHLLKFLLSEKSKGMDQTPFSSGVNNLNGRFQALPSGPISSVLK